MQTQYFKFKKAKDDLDKLIQAFLKGAQLGKFENYHIEGDLLLYKKVITESHRIQATGTNKRVSSSDGHKRFLAANVIARRFNQDGITHYLGNSSVLNLIGMRSTFGRVKENRFETDVQAKLSEYVTMIPFSAVRQAGLDIKDLMILEKGPSESVTRKVQAGWDKKKNDYKYKDETVHFTGACLFSVNGQVFLLDIDRNEIQHKIFNPFVVQLAEPVASIEEAYDSLKPDEVKAVEAKGIEVKRQGEWFFIKTEMDLAPEKEKSFFGEKELFRRGVLRAGSNRPNTTEFYAEVEGQPYVSGLVEHSGREHEPLRLDGWYKPVANTATRSVTISGDID